jgi:hypothetical protein
MGVRLRLFVSQLVGRPVVSSGGERLGSLRDLVVALDPSGYPPVRGLVVRAAKRDLFVPVGDVETLTGDGATLRRVDLPDGEFERRDGEVLLEEDILDKQLIDVQGARVVRANDVEVRDEQGVLSLVSVDASIQGMLRRLGPRRFVGGLEGEMIDWAVIEPLASEVPEVHLNIPHDKLARLHPSDIARIVDSLARTQGAEIMQSLDDSVAADTLEEVEQDHQAHLMELLPAERAADILDEMGPDAAADVLDDMSQQRAEHIIEHMEPAESKEVRQLLTYDEGIVGSLMTTDYLAAGKLETVGAVVQRIRESENPSELLPFVLVVEDMATERLMGVVSPRDLLLAAPSATIESCLRQEVRTVHPDTQAAEAVRVMTEYNLLVLPVTNHDGVLIGVVTADDALEYLLPDHLKRHVPRLFR